MSQLVLFGLPPLPEAKGHRLAREFSEYLGGVTGTAVEVRVYANYSELSDHLAEGALDFAWLPPLPAAGLRRHCGVAILAHAIRSGLHTYYSVVFVRDVSDIAEPADLNGKRIAYVHRRSASGFLVAAAQIREQGLVPDSPPRFLKSHSRVAEAVASGEVDAGATFCTFEGDPGDGKVLTSGWNQAGVETPMRIVLRTNPIPADVICAWPGTSMAARSAITSALLGMGDDDTGSALINEIFGAERFDTTDMAGLDLLDLALETPAEESP